MARTETALQPTSQTERALVARAWSEVDAAERLGVESALTAFTARFTTEREAALAWFQPPDSSMLPEKSRRAYQSDNNVTRYHKTMGYLRQGETVYEVGVGRGFLATMLIRGADLRGYRGVDIMSANVTATRQMLAANGLGDNIDIRKQDLYNLTRADVEEVGATLLVCCEVIEHVPDPELALRTLADALPEGTDLLWSVPLLGRLERVWGHTSVFSASRVQQMLEDAGLYAHHVDMVANTWLFVLASRTPAPSPRATSAMADLLPPEPSTLADRPLDSFVNESPGKLTTAPSRWTRRVEDVHVTTTDAGKVRVQARAQSGGTWASYAGAAFACPEGTAGVRIQVSPDATAMSHLYIDFYSGPTRIGRWTWDLESPSPQGPRPTFLVRPGVRNAALRRSSGTSAGADTVEVFGRARDGGGIDFLIERWAWASR